MKVIKTKLYKKANDSLKGGLADGKADEDFDKKELSRGQKVEFEHTDNPEIAKEIAKDHLVEHDDYYTGLEYMEKTLEEIEQKNKKEK